MRQMNHQNVAKNYANLICEVALRYLSSQKFTRSDSLKNEKISQKLLDNGFWLNIATTKPIQMIQKAIKSYIQSLKSLFYCWLALES